MTDDRRTIRVFISSTFRDMHAERDHLVKVVFPALRERLDPYRIDLVDIDLRWGITEAQAEDGRVLSLCLEQIDASRPFFVGLLGQRYGWVPAELPTDAVQRYDWVQRETGRSITELEILHGVLNNPEMRGRAFFYFRDPSALEAVPEDRRSVYEDQDPVLQERLRELKDRILASGLPVMNGYPARWEAEAYDRPTGSRGRLGGLQAFGDQVLDELWEAIRAEQDLPVVPPREATTSPLQREHAYHERFMDGRLEGYTGRDDVHRALLAYVEGDDPRPLMLTGPSGSGKSSILARLAREVQEEIRGGARPDLLLVPHFTGASPRSTSLRGLLTRVLDTLQLAYGVEYETGAELRDLIETFRTALEQVPEDRRLLLVVDAVNQFEERDGAGRLTWLPATLPPNARVVLSALRPAAETSEERAAHAARVTARRGYPVLELEPLSDEERRAIAREIPSIAAKTLDERQLELLLSNPATRNPLFLRVALEELRGFPSFEALNDRILQFPQPTEGRDPVEEIFLQVIGRLEEDFDPLLVREVLSLLASARRGLSEPELRQLVEGLDGAGDLFPVLRQLRPYLMRRAELIAFFHDALGKAARTRCLSAAAQQEAAHGRLADFFDTQPDFLDHAVELRTPNVRKVDELPWQLLRSAGVERLAERLQQLTFVEAKAEAGLVDDLAADFRAALEALAEDDPQRYVLRVLSRALEYETGFLLRHPECVFQVLWNRGWWYDAPLVANFFAADGGVPGYVPPWGRPGPKVHSLLEAWREERAGRPGAWPCIRRVVPPPDLFAVQHTVLRSEADQVQHVAWSPEGQLASASPVGPVEVWSGSGEGERIRLEGGRWIAWSPDGRYLASVSPTDGHLRVWLPGDPEKPVLELAEDARVNHFAWSPDGRHLAVACSDGSVRIWRAAPSGEVVSLGEHRNAATFIAWSPLGVRLATASADHSACIWHQNRTGPAFVFRGHNSRVDRLAWSADGERLLSSSDSEQTVAVWRADGQGEPLVFEGTGAAAWSPDGERIASASPENTVWVLRPDAAVPLILRRFVVLRGHAGEVSHLAWSPDGAHLASASDDCTVRVWRADGGGEAVVLHGHEATVHEVTWSPGGTRLASASSDGTVRLWQAREQGEPLAPRGHGDDVKDVSWSPDGERLASASNDGTLRVWRADGREEAIVLSTPILHRARAERVVWSPDGERLAGAYSDASVRLWQADGQTDPIQRLSGGPLYAVWTRIAWSPDRERVASADRYVVWIWRADGRGEPQVLRGHGGVVQDLAWSPDGARLATASWDRFVRVWRADGRAEHAGLRRHTGRVNCVAWSPDGARLASAAGDNLVRVWAADGGGEVVELRGHKDEVNHVAWSPDGERLASASHDGTLRVWRADGQLDPLLFLPHRDRVLQAAWSPDGKYLASACDDAGVRVWPADGPGDPVVVLEHQGPVHHVAWSPDSRCLASAGWPVRLWWVGSVDGSAVLSEEGARHLAWSPDGERLAGSVSIAGEVKVWRVADPVEPFVLQGPDREVAELAWSPDGQRLASVGGGGVRIWRIEGSGDSLVLNDGPVEWMAWSPAGDRLAGVTATGTVRIWRADGTGEPVILRGPGASELVDAWTPAAPHLRYLVRNTGIESRLDAAHDGRTVGWLEVCSSLEPVVSPHDPTTQAAASGPNVLVFTLEGS